MNSTQSLMPIGSNITVIKDFADFVQILPALSLANVNWGLKNWKLRFSIKSYGKQYLLNLINHLATLTIAMSTYIKFFPMHNTLRTLTYVIIQWMSF